MFGNYISEKELISQKCKELLQLNNNKTNLKWEKKLNRYFSKDPVDLSCIFFKRINTKC